MSYAIKERRFSTVPAFVISLVVFIAIIIGFDIINAKNNSYLIQAELVLTLLALALPGILTRSKLKSLLVIFLVPIAYIIPRTLGMFSPWVYFTEFTSPSGVLTEFMTIISDLTARTGGLPTDLDRAQDLLREYGRFIDLGALFICAVFVAILVTTLVTGVGDGIAVILSLILKVIAIIFLIFFLFILPFFYLALATATEGVSYAGVGATHSYSAFEELADTIDPNIDYDYILNELDQASPAFLSASESFKMTESNLLADFALGYFGYDDEFQSIKYFLKAGSLLTAPEGLGEFILGFRDFQAGIEIAMSQATLFSSVALPSQNSKIASIHFQQEDNFTQGLVLLDSGLNHFRNGIPNLLLALNEVQKGVELLADLNNPDIDLVVAQIPLAQEAIGVMGQVSETVIPLVNGTYFMTQAFSLIAENRFSEASFFISASKTEIDISQQLFMNISQDIDPENTLSPVPYAVYALRDLTTIASSLVAAANYAIDTFLSMADVITLLTNLNLINLATINWVQIESQLGHASNNVTLADKDLNYAQSNASEFMLADYGPLNTTFHPIMGTLNESIAPFLGIVGDAVILVDFMDNLYLAVSHFAYGSDYMQTGQYVEAEAEFEASISSAETALTLLDEVDDLDSGMISNLSDILTDLMLGASLARDAVQDLESDPSLIDDFETYLDLLEDLFGADFGSIFGSPTLFIESSILKYQALPTLFGDNPAIGLNGRYQNSVQINYHSLFNNAIWMVFNCNMLVGIIGVHIIDEQLKRRLLVQKL